MINPNMEQQLLEEKKQSISEEILRDCRNELYLNMRFLDVALSALRFLRDDGIPFLATDGSNLYYNPQQLMQTYRQSKELVNRAYFHALLHCLFWHGFLQESRGTVIRREKECWDLACDMAVELMMDTLYLKCIHRPKSRAYQEAAMWVQAEVLSGDKASAGSLTAQKIYRSLCAAHFPPEQLCAWKEAFSADDHQYWYRKRPNMPTRPRQKEQWEDIREKMQTEMELFSKEAGKSSQVLQMQLQAANRKRYNYREFLRKFAVLQEVMQVDMHTFDYIYYQYGMQLYHNMPLIEPLETKEINQIQEFVIVIDTSMSCKETLVQKFLDQTWAILKESESFSRRIHVHILQCDDKVREDVLIERPEQLEQYRKNFTVTGLGGTDFRPPFAYVEELRQKGEFHRLRGLLYFTDGYGIFPVKKPDYDVAFIFMREDYQDVDVPPWAIRLILEEEDLEDMK